ncbi:helix-turn-helix domain-containing protein [Zhihengliuella halotolerans]|uniref:Helix-turn-helix protein n=1 Tax=Zhihengliuella halotolerans TaxID=370736 RepID=A0A4Q8ADC9_9MICC|nr:helix-turn-helix transcriptional regulator [Zhihengliuella halotolerans]RZU62237.1 hypothetical protein EV380_1830 [Zhihengliuella halotolerans]
MTLLFWAPNRKEYWHGPPPPSDVFAKRIRAERLQAGFEREALSLRIAVLLGGPIDPTLVRRFEEQTRAPRLDEAVAAATALDVSLLTLINGDGGRAAPEAYGSEPAS